MIAIDPNFPIGLNILSSKGVADMIRILAILAFFCLGACASGPKYNVNTSSLASPDVSNYKTYELWPADNTVQANDLQFIEYTTYIERAFAAKGFERVDFDEEPEIVVLVGYGIGEPKEHSRTYSIPTFGQTGVSSSRTTGTATTNVYGSSSYATGYTNYNQTTTYTPTYGITGYATGQQNYTTFTRHISLSGYFADFEVPSDVWKPAFETTITSTGSSGDLRHVFPIMVAAAADKIATSTEEAELDAMSADDPRVLMVKGLSNKTD